MRVSLSLLVISCSNVVGSNADSMRYLDSAQQQIHSNHGAISLLCCIVIRTTDDDGLLAGITTLQNNDNLHTAMVHVRTEFEWKTSRWLKCIHPWWSIICLHRSVLVLIRTLPALMNLTMVAEDLSKRRGGFHYTCMIGFAFLAFRPRIYVGEKPFCPDQSNHESKHTWNSVVAFSLHLAYSAFPLIVCNTVNQHGK